MIERRIDVCPEASSRGSWAMGDEAVERIQVILHSIYEHFPFWIFGFFSSQHSSYIVEKFHYLPLKVHPPTPPPITTQGMRGGGDGQTLDAELSISERSFFERFKRVQVSQVASPQARHNVRRQGRCLFRGIGVGWKFQTTTPK